jgi:2,3-bisphosphoglycerate-independent phosphoglycerate mutase
MNGVILVIYDGLGLAFPGPGNAFFLAEPEHFKNLQKEYPHTQLAAAGEAVGLPKDEAGNTEVGHINITSGRVMYQSLPRIDLSIASWWARRPRINCLTTDLTNQLLKNKTTFIEVFN